jgi:hypothetical protein
MAPARQSLPASASSLHRALASAGTAAIRAAGRIMWVFAWAVACGETCWPLVMLEPNTAELISRRHQPGNLPEHGQATKEITMHQRQPPADNERPAPPAQTMTPAMTSPAPSPPNLVHRRQLEKSGVPLKAWTL